MQQRLGFSGNTAGFRVEGLRLGELTAASSHRDEGLCDNNITLQNRTCLHSIKTQLSD